ncbi:hypothetical protein [Chromobacterium violaceum]|uniref:Uncharacterized protein n=1 Tax=Chromobacterium violaceum TaxID=536 RepID=A0A202BCZ5_CHRVL|nr:hypothetical protein [Chromobacterium violaceum]OVE49426.1 hypothetical protein CBW21_05960 [Chromobacterium violaceum]
MATYVLATTGDKVRWYVYQRDKPEAGHTLADSLDLSATPLWGNKESAKSAALKMGLKTWRYVSI